jgi:hypothetical protein
MNRRFRDPTVPVCTLDEVPSLRTPINNIADIIVINTQRNRDNYHLRSDHGLTSR